MEKISKMLMSTMTTSEVAKSLGVNERTIRRYISKLFPGKAKNGAVTYLNESEVTAIKLNLEKNQHLDRSVQLPKTDLEKKMLVQQAMNILSEEIEELKERVDSLAPKAIEYDRFISSDGLLDMREASKCFNTGRNKLFAKLRELGILMADNVPYQNYVNSGYFEVKQIVKNDINYSVTMVTPRGIEYISKQLEKGE